MPKRAMCFMDGELFRGVEMCGLANCGEIEGCISDIPYKPRQGEEPQPSVRQEFQVGDADIACEYFY
jgi:hypothetical protein